MLQGQNWLVFYLHDLKMSNLPPENSETKPKE